MYGTDPGHLTNIEKMSSFLENQHEISRKIKIGFSVENSHMGGGIKLCAISPCCQNKFSKLFGVLLKIRPKIQEKLNLKILYVF